MVGDALVRHPDIALVSFTGSTAAGRKIAAAAGGAPKRLVLELGGNAPVIVYDDIDLEAALPILTNGVLFNAGQECMSATRMLVSEGIHPPAGELYNCVESARGELGFYLVSDGGNRPYRLRVRSPSFPHVEVLKEVIPGLILSDVVVAIASVDPILGDVDR